MKKYFLITILFIFWLAIFLPQTSLAYVEISEGSNLIATVIPENPKAGDIVNISLRSLGFSLGSKAVTWKINGVVKQSGLGIANYSFQLGKPGTIVKVEIATMADNYIPKKKTLFFQSSELDLIWQSNSYVPSVYKAKALPSAGSIIKVVAMPTIVDSLGAKVPTSQINFDWKKDDVLAGNASGSGKNSFTFKTDSNARSVKIEAIASVPKEKLVVSANTNIVLQSPLLLFYENQALDGVAYQKTISGEYPLYNTEVTIKAEPYFFDMANPLNIIYSWVVNQDKIDSNQNDPSLVTFRQKEGTEGISKINASVKNSLTGQQADSNFIIKFGSRLTNFNGQ